MGLTFPETTWGALLKPCPGYDQSLKADAPEDGCHLSVVQITTVHYHPAQLLPTCMCLTVQTDSANGRNDNKIITNLSCPACLWYYDSATLSEAIELRLWLAIRGPKACSVASETSFHFLYSSRSSPPRSQARSCAVRKPKSATWRD